MPGSTLNQKQEAALRWRRTKILATLGPASNSPETIEKLILAGADAFRINMSHGEHEHHRQAVKQVREIAQRCQKHVAIVMDLCGPKIRVGKFENGFITLQDEDEITVTCRDVTGQSGLIPSQYSKLHQDIKIGERILLDDGNLELKALNISGTEIQCKIIHGGILKNNKGMNLPDSILSTSSFTDKDKRDAKLAIELETDFLALSFVRSAEDVLRLQEFIAQHGTSIAIISKIEKPEAITNIKEILECSYGIMVARGDLGIEVPAEKVPLLQQDLIQLAREYNRPVIVATQMLESMIEHSRPTRAEVGDVANAALSSTDAVMLSGETAAGKHPIMAVETMDRVLREIEAHQWKQGSFTPSFQKAAVDARALSDRAAVASATINLARNLNLQGIIIPTCSGTTTRIISASRPLAPCIGVCSNPLVNQQMALSWGVVPVLVNEPQTHDWRKLCNIINEQVELITEGESVLLVSGFNDKPKLNEPVMKILTL